VFDEHVEFLERSLVEQRLDALAGQIAPCMLRLDALLAAAQFGARMAGFAGFTCETRINRGTKLWQQT
jgi:hypothetical protein